MPYAININHWEAENINQLSENEVLISIYDNHTQPWALKVSGPQVLQLQFTDITANVTRNGLEYYTINDEQANELLKFMIEAANKRKNIIVNCHAGVSRSSAIALAANILFGYELKPNFWQLSIPNCYILGILLRNCNQYFK